MTQSELPLTVGRITQLETWPRQEERKVSDEAMKEYTGGRAVKGTLEPLGQIDHILGHLLTGGAITPLEALKMYGCMRLGARIWDLKKMGYKIKTKMVKDGDKRYAEYSL